jgi:hypothetical protein
MAIQSVVGSASVGVVGEDLGGVDGRECAGVPLEALLVLVGLVVKVADLIVAHDGTMFVAAGGEGEGLRCLRAQLVGAEGAASLKVEVAVLDVLEFGRSAVLEQGLVHGSHLEELLDSRGGDGLLFFLDAAPPLFKAEFFARC